MNEHQWPLGRNVAWEEGCRLGNGRLSTGSWLFPLCVQCPFTVQGGGGFGYMTARAPNEVLTKCQHLDQLKPPPKVKNPSAKNPEIDPQPNHPLKSKIRAPKIRRSKCQNNLS